MPDVCKVLFGVTSASLIASADNLSFSFQEITPERTVPKKHSSTLQLNLIASQMTEIPEVSGLGFTDVLTALSLLQLPEQSQHLVFESLLSNNIQTTENEAGGLTVTAHGVSAEGGLC